MTRDERFKIWRSRQPYWMNVIIDWALFLKDMLALLLIGTGIMALIAVLVLWLLQTAGNAYSG
jgi:hypothetical protein